MLGYSSTRGPQAGGRFSRGVFDRRLCVRSIGVALLAIVAAVLVALTSTTTSVYTLAAATYILPGLLGYPFSDQASMDLATRYISGATGTAPPAPLIVLYLPAVPPPDSIE